MIDEFDRDIGLDRLAAVHANDSKRACGSGVDRHDNIGEGLIGEQGFENIMSQGKPRVVWARGSGRGSPRLGICPTSARLAAGYDLTNPEGVADMIGV